jgi:hypothetical protein
MGVPILICNTVSLLENNLAIHSTRTAPRNQCSTVSAVMYASTCSKTCSLSSVWPGMAVGMRIRTRHRIEECNTTVSQRSRSVTKEIIGCYLCSWQLTMVTHGATAFGTARFRTYHGLNRPISAHFQGVASLRASPRILVRRLERRSRQRRDVPFGSVRRNISSTC